MSPSIQKTLRLYSVGAVAATKDSAKGGLATYGRHWLSSTLRCTCSYGGRYCALLALSAWGVGGSMCVLPLLRFFDMYCKMKNARSGQGSLFHHSSRELIQKQRQKHAPRGIRHSLRERLLRESTCIPQLRTLEVKRKYRHVEIRTGHWETD